MFNQYKPSVLNNAGPDQTQQNAASDQGLHSLLTEGFTKFELKLKIPTNVPINENALVQLISVKCPFGLNGLHRAGFKIS